MEFITSKDAPHERVAIPDSVVAASNNRDLVTQYIAAGAVERQAIEERATARLTPPAPAAPSSQLDLAEDVEEG